MKLVFFIVVAMCALLPEALGLVKPKPTKASCLPTTPTKAPPPVCGKNEIYSQCGATGCVDTCANPTFSQISFCTCIPGCICIEGYLRNSKNECVAPQQCDTCKENEEFSPCDAHGCRNTCAEPERLASCEYAAGCYPGCICIEGYLKNTDGVCVPEATCVKKCPENEAYNECGTACPKTCKTKDVLFNCIAKCVAGCFCLEGYIRDDISGKCILERDCPLVCGPNQVINKCPPCPEGLFCPAVCIPICECKPGYILDKTGTCIAKEPKTYPGY